MNKHRAPVFETRKTLAVLSKGEGKMKKQSYYDN